MADLFQIADVVEIQTWAANRTYSIASLKEDLEAILPDADAKAEAERYSDEAFELFENRQRALGNSYPFEVDGNTIASTASAATSTYLFCLGLSFLPSVPNDMRTRQFEAIVKEAAELYFRGTGVRIGAPWRTGKITDYSKLLQLVANLIPELGRPLRTAAPGGGDFGWDIVIVNNFVDKLFSRIIALGNCATGSTNWRTKGNETEAEYFWDGFSVPPERKNVCIRFLAVPFHMTKDDKDRKQSRDNILFDRIRIAHLAPTASATALRWVEKNRSKAMDLSLV